MDYPTLSQLPDGTSLLVQYDDPGAQSQQSDGNYYISRPAYTRAAPRTFSFQYINMSQADYVALESFWRTQAKGSSVAFNWTHPVTSEVINVRFGQPGQQFFLQLQRFGFGDNHRYKSNVIVITEV